LKFESSILINLRDSKDIILQSDITTLLRVKNQDPTEE